MAWVGEILVVCPQERDRHAARSTNFRVRFAGPDLDAAPVDGRALLEELAELPADGVVGTKDRSALLAAQLAERRGLPGPSPAAIVSCQHKPSSRAIQQRLAPQATPRFALADRRRPFRRRGGRSRSWAGCPGGAARRRRGRAQLVDDQSYRDEYAELAGLPEDAVRGFLVEELVTGDEVTLEGFVHEGEVTVIGVTDSVKYLGTSSFERFEYPSALPLARLDELAELAALLVPRTGSTRASSTSSSSSRPPARRRSWS